MCEPAPAPVDSNRISACARVASSQVALGPAARTRARALHTRTRRQPRSLAAATARRVRRDLNRDRAQCACVCLYDDVNALTGTRNGSFQAADIGNTHTHTHPIAKRATRYARNRVFPTAIRSQTRHTHTHTQKSNRIRSPQNHMRLLACVSVSVSVC